ncbi:MAG: PQQ-like beta-propeller repeat protein [Actinomycetota bacterium]|nr:PQQ-like beta-propeller repeat protein [Actinomycetota bacterium]
MPSPGSRRKLRWVLAAVVIVVIALGVTVAFLSLHSPGNVSHPSLSFTQPTTTQATPARPRKVVVNDFEWPRYGFDAARTRYFPAPARLAPPFRVGWRFNDGALLEFPPVIYQNTLYLLDDNGWAKAIDKRSGHRIWQHRIGTLAAASPAIDVKNHLVFFPLLSINPSAGQHPGNGRVVALSMGTGRVAWSKPVPPGTESSPLVWQTTLYFGDQGGTVRSLRARDGHVNWTYHASGAVKGGPSLAGGNLYFGDYAGRAYALNAATGHQIWAVSTSGTRFGFGSGNFYSTPAIAFGRVYMGNTDGRVYSFAARTGQLAWATGTGAYVYASPAVAEIPGLGPTVLLGSYDGNFYAFNAQSGAVRWSHPSGGRISGSATIVGKVVYYSDLGSKSTIGLSIGSGRQVFSFSDGAFNPVIADATAIYMSGYGEIYQMLPKAPVAHPGAAKPKPAPPRSLTKKPKPATPRPAKRRRPRT